jgi:hypothetical protein
MQNAQSVALQLEKVRDGLPLLYERDDILLTMISGAQTSSASAGVAVCKHCSAILDEDKGAKHGWGAGAAAARATRVNSGEILPDEKKSRS